MKKFFQRGKKIYWWLIGTFALLYLAVAFVSTLHAITFFQLANSMGLAILLGAAYEVGQATVLFSILMSQNKNKVLAWGMMFLLTALQVTANVYASFKYMDASGSNDWTFWQRAILFGVQAENDEMYKVIISWISGALLPLVALGMTALVADNIKLLREGEEAPEVKPEIEEKEDDDDPPLFGNLFKKKKKEEVVEEESVEEKPVDDIIEKVKEGYERIEKVKDIDPKEVGLNLETKIETLKKPITVELQSKEEHELLDFVDEPHEVKTPQVSEPFPSMEEAVKDLEENLLAQEPMEVKFEAPIPLKDIKPVNRPQGWHFHKEFVDEEHNVFQMGKFIGNDPSKTPTPPKPKKA